MMIFKTVWRLRVDMDNFRQTNTVMSVRKVSPESLKESHAGVEMWRFSGHQLAKMGITELKLTPYMLGVIRKPLRGPLTST